MGGHPVATAPARGNATGDDGPRVEQPGCTPPDCRYGGGVDVCPECDNRDMRVRVVDGAPIHECGLCGARFGDRAAIERLEDTEEATRRGIDLEVFPLVRAFDRVPGLLVREASAGDPERQAMPFVRLGPASAGAMIQLENVTKSVLLAAGELRRHWVIEVEYQRNLLFVLKPRLSGRPATPEGVREAQLDLDVLRRHLERDVKLQWWRPVQPAGNG